MLALDNDPLSVEATTANASVNGVAELIDVRRFELRSEPVPPARLVLGNLLAPLLRGWCAALRSGVGSVPGRLVAGGLLVDESDAISSAFADVGLRERARRTRDGWAALLLAAG